jgi:hypothetical protein
MTNEELLQRRVIVNGLYPFSKYKVGQILSFSIAPNGITRFYYDKTDTYYPIEEEWVILCPNIFTPIKWYENRGIEDMPKYVKLAMNGKVQYAHKVERWIGGNSAGVPLYEFYGRSNELLIGVVIDLVPATEQEFIDYKKTFAK